MAEALIGISILWWLFLFVLFWAVVFAVVGVLRIWSHVAAIRRMMETDRQQRQMYRRPF